MIKSLLFSLFIVSSLLTIKAQTSFSNEPNVFIDEFVKYMKISKNQEIQKMADNFSVNWKTSKFTAEQKKFIINIANEIMYKNLGRDPYLELMLSNLDLYFQRKLNANILKQWQEITKLMLEKSPKDYLFFLQTANTLFKDNTLHQSNSIRWYASNSNYEFIYDKKRVGIVFKNLDLFCQAGIDKVQILNSSGVFYPDKKTWLGERGRVNWERVDKPESEVYVTFLKHRIDMNSGGFIVDSALMTYPKISAEKLYGRLTERISQGNSQN
jgi:hypothetical protein